MGGKFRVKGRELRPLRDAGNFAPERPPNQQSRAFLLPEMRQTRTELFSLGRSVAITDNETS
jgi:hypothetical protein